MASSATVNGQLMGFKDTLKKTLTTFNIDATHWEAALWRSMIHTEARKTGSRLFRKSVLFAKQDFILAPALQPTATCPCPRSAKELAKIGLIDHFAPTGPTNFEIIFEVMIVG